MHPKLQALIYEKEAFAGVECLQKEGNVYYNLCVLKKEKGNAKILLQQQDILSVSALKEFIKEDMPVFLVINTKGILNKFLDYFPESKEEALSTVFPSANQKDFHVQQLETGTNKGLISIIRKDKAIHIINGLNAANIWIVNAFIGPFWIQEILPILPVYVNKIQTGQQLLSIDQQVITAFAKDETQPSELFSVGDERVHEKMLSALSMAFLAITQPNIQGIVEEIIQTQQHNFYYKKLTHYTTLFALGFFFIALLGNYLLFEKYNNQEQALKIEVAQQGNLLNQRDSLVKKYEDKSALLGDQLHLGRSKSSYYADQLAATVPSTLQLTNLVLFPEIKEAHYSSEKKLPRYDNQLIIVAGKCQASVFYNNWKRSLEELDWIASIHNISYQNNTNGQGIFKLEITLADE